MKWRLPAGSEGASRRKLRLYACFVSYNHRGGWDCAALERERRASLAAADGGEKLKKSPTFWVANPDARRAATQAFGYLGHPQASVESNEIFGPPRQPRRGPWLTVARCHPDALSIATHCYDSMDFGQLPILADLAEELGAESDVVEHLRSPGPHFRGCWALDLVLGKK